MVEEISIDPVIVVNPNTGVAFVAEPGSPATKEWTVLSKEDEIKFLGHELAPMDRRYTVLGKTPFFCKDVPYVANTEVGAELDPKVYPEPMKDTRKELPMNETVPTEKEEPKFKALGQVTGFYDHPSPDIMEAAEYDSQGLSGQCFRFTCPEFTSLCPATGQPDFATLVIDYIPSEYIVESKSLKLYLGSYRNHGAFHEACTLQIAKDFMSIAEPLWFRIAAYWYPRGGIPIDVFWQSGVIPFAHSYVPELTTPQYRGR